MKTITKFWTLVIASAGKAKVAASAPMSPDSALGPEFLALLRLVEEAAALEEARSLLGGDLDVARREEEDLVGDALHAAVEGIRQPTREVDQPLRELLVRALEVEDDRDRLVELVRDLLRIVEAALNDVVVAGGAM